MERIYAFVDLMMLAILADGTLLDEEVDVLEARLLEAPELQIGIEEAKSRIRFKAETIDTPEKMRKRMKAAVSDLSDPADRALAYQLAAELHHEPLRRDARDRRRRARALGLGFASVELRYLNGVLGEWVPHPL